MDEREHRKAGAVEAGRARDPLGPVLVTGGAGYVGSHTVRMLRDRGVPTVVFDDLSTGHREAAGEDLVVGDLADAGALAAVFREHRPRSVIHFAAKCYVGESVRNPAVYWQQNVVHTWNLLDAMRQADCREIVFSSTCATYGMPRELPISETHPQDPISPYGRTKLAMEHMIEDYGRAYDFATAALRYFNAAGADPDGSLGEVHDPETHLIPLALGVALGEQTALPIFGDDYDTPDGTCIRDYVHVVDLADAHLRALARLQDDTSRLVCNLGTGRGYSVQEVVEVARRVTGHPIPTRCEVRRPGDPAELVSAAGLARELLGWIPRRPALEDIVGDAWAFRQRHPHGYRRA